MKNAIIAIAAIVILGGGVYFFMNQGENTPEILLDFDNENEQEGLTVKDSLFSWLKKGSGVECTIDAEEGQTTVYTLGDKVRMDGVSMMPEGEDMDSGTFLSDGKFVYIWSGTEGIKMDLESLENLPEEDEASEAEQYSWESIAQEWDRSGVKYDCREKKLDNTMFDVPGEVAFIDWTEMLTGITDMAEKMQASTEEGSVVDMEEMRKMMEEMEIPAEE